MPPRDPRPVPCPSPLSSLLCSPPSSLLPSGCPPMWQFIHGLLACSSSRPPLLHTTPCNGYLCRLVVDLRLPLLSYVAAGQVTIATAVPRESPQIPTFADCVRKHGDDARWLAFIDVDEFLFSPRGPLPSVLKGYEQYAGIVIPWLLFGSSNHTDSPRGLVIENYVHRKRLPECNGGTCAFKVIAQVPLNLDTHTSAHYFKGISSSLANAHVDFLPLFVGHALPRPCANAG